MQKKRLLTLLLVICLIVSCLSPAASAVGAGRTFGNDVQKNDTASVSEPLRYHDGADDVQTVVSGSSANHSAAQSTSKTPGLDKDAAQASASDDGSWQAEPTQVSGSLLSSANADTSSVEELQALAATYKADEIVTAFVVLEDAPLAESYSSVLYAPESEREAMEAAQARVIAEMEATVAQDSDLTVVSQFMFLTNAIVVETPFENLAKIAQLDSVASVFIAPVFYPASTEAEQMTVSAGQMTNVSEVWNINGDTGYTGSGMTIAILDTGLDLDHPSFAADPQLAESSWTKESLQKLIDAHSDKEDTTTLLNAVARYKGTLTANDLYYNAKVPFTFNYALGTTNVSHNDAIGDHGTHVAGIAAANPVDGIGVVGMAPDAQLIVMKVFNSQTGGSTLTDFVAALEDCILLDVDIANLSLGSAAGFTGSGYAEIDAIFERIANTGLVVNIAAGNEGTSAAGSLYGEQKALTSSVDNATVSSPSTYTNAMSIASVNNTYVASNYFTFGDEETKVFYQPCVEYLYGQTNVGLQEMLADQTLEYVFANGLGAPEDFYDEAGNSLVEGKVAIIQRGTLNFGTKVKNASDAGAVAAIIWNNATEDIYSFGMSVVENETYPTIPAILITLQDGQAMLDAENHTMTVKTDAGLRIDPKGGQMSSFSSWGVSPDLRLLPDLAGIGGNVFSTLDGGFYGVMSGTSMATPQVCGVTALVKQYLADLGIDGTDNREMAQALMMSTANPVVDSTSNVEASPRQQGAGLVNALKAVSAGAYLTVDGDRPKAELGDSEDGTYTFTFEVHNFSDKDQSYTLSSSLLTEDYVESNLHDDVTYMAGHDCKLDGTVSFSNNSLTVPAGETVPVEVTITLSNTGKNWINEHFENGNYVEGYIYLTAEAEDGVDLNLPFLGFYQSWSQAPVFDNGFWYSNDLWASSNLEGVNSEISAEEYWTIPWISMGASVNDWFLGMNPYSGVVADVDGNVIYSSENNVISPNGDGLIDKVSDYYMSLLRNARYVWLTATDEDGNVLHRQVMEYEGKTMYLSNNGSTIPTVYSWYNNPSDLYDFTDADGNPLPDGAKVTLTISAVVDYDLENKVEYQGNEAIPVHADDEIVLPITIDVTKPELLTDSIREVNKDGKRYLEVTFNDAHPAIAAVLNPTGTQTYDTVYDYNSRMFQNQDGSYTALLDITGHGDDFMIAVADYGYNETYYNVSRTATSNNDPVVDTSALYAYQVYHEAMYYYYGWDAMFGWVTADTDMTPSDMPISMVNSDAKEYYAINAADYVDGLIFAVDAGNNLLYMKPGLWNRNTICNLPYNVVDMAFHDETGTMYVIVSDSEAGVYGLATLDLLTGEVELVKSYPYGQYGMPWAMTFVDGKLYCCKYFSTGLYEIDLDNDYAMNQVTLADGTPLSLTTSNGSEIYPAYAQSMTYSEGDGLIYWFYCDSGSDCELFAIDPETWNFQSKSLGTTEYVAALTLEETEYQIPASEVVTRLSTPEAEHLMSVGSSKTLQVYATPWNVPGYTLTWESSNTDVATVVDGVVTAVGEGKATVTARCGDASVEFQISALAMSGTMYAFNYSGDATDYGYWQSIDLATMKGVNLEGTNVVDFIAAEYNGHDGCIYGFDGALTSWRYNPETGEATELEGGGYVIDMAYDYTSGIMYAIMNNSTTLYAMNMNNGKLVEIGDTHHYAQFATISCDMDGNIYAIDIAGNLNKLVVTDDADEGGSGGGGGGGGGGIIILKALREALTQDIVISPDPGFGVGGETGNGLSVSVEQLAAFPFTENIGIRYGQSMCYDPDGHALIWCYTDAASFYRINLPEEGEEADYSVFNLGSVNGYMLPQYFGLHMIPDEIPALPDVPVESIKTSSMFLLAGASATPEVTVDPVNANEAYYLLYGSSYNKADEDSKLPAIEIVDGQFHALRAGTAYVDVYAVRTDEYTTIAEAQADPECIIGNGNIRVTVKNSTSSVMRAYHFSGDNWVDVDQYDVEGSEVLGIMGYEGAYYNVCAAEYLDGVIYAYGYELNSWDSDDVFMTIDPKTMGITSLTVLDSEFPFVYDMAYDYTSGTMYVLAGPSDIVTLYYADLTTGKLIPLYTPEETFLSITVDANGTMYMISKAGDSTSKMYTFDVETGTAKLLLDTQVASYYAAGLAYDFETGYLYWTPDSGVYLIDLTDSTTNRLGSLGGQTRGLVLVNDKPEIPTELKHIILSSSREELNVGQSTDLELFIQPPAAQYTTSWTSADPEIATVDENGVVTAVSAGTTQVTATVTNGTVTLNASCNVIVYGDEDYFITYNVTDKGFSRVNRLDPTQVTNLTENEEYASINAMTQVGETVYAYDEEGNFFTATAAEGFERHYLGNHGIDVSELDSVVENSAERSTYTAVFTVRDMTVYGDKLLVLGAIGYNVHSEYFYNGFLWQTSDYYAEKVGGSSGLYEVDLETGKLTQVCTLYHSDGTYMVGAVMLTVDESTGRLFVYNTYNDHITVVDPETGYSTFLASLQSLRVLGDPYAIMGMTYDEATNNIYMIHTSNSNYFRMYKLNVASCAVNEIGYMGEVEEVDWALTGDLFHGLLIHTPENAPFHKHDYQEVYEAPTCVNDGRHGYVCDCGEVLSMEVLPATGEHDFQPNEQGDLVCSVCGKVEQVTKPEPPKPTVKPPFTDVSTNDWFYDAVSYVYNNGLMDGMGKNLFAPNDHASRAMIVQTLYRMAGSPKPEGTNRFTDLKDEWYRDAVQWAYENGVANGRSETIFDPAAEVTREELAAFLYRYAALCKMDVSARADLSVYSDAAKVSTWATDYMSWACAVGLINGRTSTTLVPLGTATRAELATLLMRLDTLASK